RGLEVKPFFMMYRTDQLNNLLDRLSKFSRFWSTFANVGIFISVVAMVFALTFLLRNLYSYFFLKPEDFAQVALLLPGVTIQTPVALTYFLLSLPFILIIHEGAHGVIARLEKIRIKSSGILLVVTLIGAFVEPDQEEFKKARHSSRLRVFAAGSAANILFSFIVLIFLVLTPTFAPILPNEVRPVFYEEPSGLLVRVVSPDSPAERSGLKVNDIIVGVDGHRIKSLEDYIDLNLKPNRSITLKVLRDGSTILLNVETIPSPIDRSRGVIGFGGITFYPPRLFPSGIYWPPHVALFLFWVWFLSFNVGLFNMLPIYPLDGDGFINTILNSRLSVKKSKVLRLVINIFALSLVAINLIISIINYGLFVI
ncbi:MAG: site-2 protease family protein, partial [Nitrososphaerales archaeon]|nr:site-2 protease family protein [Nitrososphaerales archaeon]